MKRAILTGIRVNEEPTIGNYLGAYLPMIRLAQEYAGEYEINMFVPDLHSFTTPIDHSKLYDQIIKGVKYYIAAGLDVENPHIHVYRQSHVPSHCELTWILDCFTYMGELNRMTQYKDKSAKHADNINAGLFTYPSLMAGDILLYQADLVPTGEDQKQHVELTRDVAQRFNNLYGETFKIPDPYIEKVGARIMGLQDPTSKMSKSSTLPNDTILLIDSKEEIIKKVKKAVTDSEGIVKYDEKNKPGISNLMEIYGIITKKSINEIEKEFEGKRLWCI